MEEEGVKEFYIGGLEEDEEEDEEGRKGRRRTKESSSSISIYINS